VTIEYSYEPSPLGTGGAIKLAERLLEDEFLVLNGDTLLDIDYGAFGAQFHRDGRLGTIAAYRNQANHVSSNLALDEHDFVIAYDKNLPTGMYIDAGVVAVRKAGISLLSPGRRCSFEQEVFPRLIAQRQLKAWPTDELFFDMGTPDGMQRLESYLRARPCAAR
jgi:mannose-1-phosphate guanylyltransferase